MIHYIAPKRKKKYGSRTERTEAAYRITSLILFYRFVSDINYTACQHSHNKSRHQHRRKCIIYKSRRKAEKRSVCNIYFAAYTHNERNCGRNRKHKRRARARINVLACETLCFCVRTHADHHRKDCKPGKSDYRPVKNGHISFKHI